MTHLDAPLQLQLLKKEYPVEHNGQIYFRWPFIPVSNLDFLMSQIMKYPHQLDCKVQWYFMLTYLVPMSSGKQEKGAHYYTMSSLLNT